MGKFWERITEQKQILAYNEDVIALKNAIGTFTSLQFVKLLRVVDPGDRKFKEYVQCGKAIEQ